MRVYPPREAVLAALQHPNVLAMEHVVREGETNQSNDAYRTINGGALFTSFERHPYEGLYTTQGGKAAGAHQWLPSTWGEIRDHYGLPDFSPESQKFAFVARMAWRGALDDVLRGNFESAVVKLREEWTSLPGAKENSKRYPMSRAREVFYEYGGFQSDGEVPLAPISETDPDADGKPGVTLRDEDRQRLQPTRETPVAAFAAFLPILQGLFTIFDPLIRAKATEGLNKLTKDEEMSKQMVPQLIELLQRTTGVIVPPAATDGERVVKLAEAVQVAQSSPEMTAKIEVEVSKWFDANKPALDMLAELDKARWAADTESINAASKRAKEDRFDIGPKMAVRTDWIFGVTLLAIVAIMGVMYWNNKQVPGELWIVVTTLVYAAARSYEKPRSYRWGEKNEGEASRALSEELQARRPK